VKNGDGLFDLSGVKALLGKEQEMTEHEAYLAKCPVDLSELRRYALSVEDYNPLWFEEEYAKKTKWKGVIAAPTFMHTCGGGSALHVDIPGVDRWPYGGVFSGSEFDFFHPIRVGDRIIPNVKLCDVVEKTGKFAGPMVLITAEVKFKNQNNKIVGIWRETVVMYSTSKAQKQRAYMSEELGEMFPSSYPDMRKGEPRARGAIPLFNEDVNIGDEVPALVRKLTIPQIVATADVASRTSNILPYTMPGPGCYWHYSVGESWKMRGLPAPMDEGPIRSSQPSQLMTDWIGDDGWLNKLNIQIRRPIYAGDITTWRGKVTNKYVKDDQYLVECEISAENQRGQISTKGNATVILPSRGYNENKEQL
jgi:acyl dehydratase